MVESTTQRADSVDFDYFGTSGIQITNNSFTGFHAPPDRIDPQRTHTYINEKDRLLTSLQNRSLYRPRNGTQRLEIVRKRLNLVWPFLVVGKGIQMWIS